MSRTRCEKCGHQYQYIELASGQIEKRHDCLVDKAIAKYRNKVIERISGLPFSRLEVTNIATQVSETKAVVERSKVIDLI